MYFNISIEKSLSLGLTYLNLETLGIVINVQIELLLLNPKAAITFW